MNSEDPYEDAVHTCVDKLYRSLYSKTGFMYSSPFSEDGLVIPNGRTTIAEVVMTTWAPPDKSPLKTSIPIEPFPISVSRAFLPLNELEDAGVNFVDVHRSLDCIVVGHISNIRLELPDAFTDDLGHDNVALFVDLNIRCSWECYCMVISKGSTGISSNGHTIFAGRGTVHNPITVLDEVLTELFVERMVLFEGRIAGIDAVLHELVEVGIGTVEDIEVKSPILQGDRGDQPDGAETRISMQRAMISRSTVVSFPWIMSCHKRTLSSQIPR